MGGTSILVILSLPIQEHRIFLHLFCSSLVSLMTVFSFYSYISYTYFVRIILKHFVWGSVNVNGRVSLVAHIIKNLPAQTKHSIAQPCVSRLPSFPTASETKKPRIKSSHQETNNNRKEASLLFVRAFSWLTGSKRRDVLILCSFAEYGGMTSVTYRTY